MKKAFLPSASFQAAQMYKIYINETPLLLASYDEIKVDELPEKNKLTLRFSGKKKQLLQVVDMLEKPHEFSIVAVLHHDLNALFQEFQQLFKLVNAAGGAVFNPNDKVLVIFRRGFWDLPKGKMDDGETWEETALREVEEETGLQGATIEKPLPDTFHTYIEKGKRILKKTVWFKMRITKTDLKLQHEEDIEYAEWVNPALFLQSSHKMYRSIREVLESCL